MGANASMRQSPLPSLNCVNESLVWLLRVAGSVLRAEESDMPVRAGITALSRILGGSVLGTCSHEKERKHATTRW